MSDLDEETKRILAEVESNDSKDIPKQKKPVKKTVEWETNEEDSPDDEW